MKKYILLFTLIFTFQSYSQEKAAVNFFVDAVAFKENTSNSGRIDVFTLVPFQSLYFLKYEEKYASKYNFIIEVEDKSGNKIETRRIERTVVAETYFASQGGDGKFDIASTSFAVKPGTYQIKIKFNDDVYNRSDERSRQITVLDFENFKLSLSGIMLLSSIEEVNGKYKITPHINDNIGSLLEGYFAFCEIYNIKSAQGKLKYYGSITDANGEVLYTTDTNSINITKEKEHLYLKFKYNSNLIGSYTLNIFMLDPEQNNGVIAAAQRSVKAFPTVYGMIRKDIDLAVRQLRYVAVSKDMDIIQESKDDFEKQKRFDEFWKKLDPTPNTERNEAFDEYYRRIAFATKSFKSYTDGWLTDKGMVYIIFGPPNNVEPFTSNVNSIRYERWTYSNNKEFLFADNNGFGDYRLVRPYSISERFTYK